ncbi:DEAD/DEAH box helicase [Mycobacterium sp. IS-1556]|uniref:DEAD/DEAH box helicase n=1 Tax=Mycobacterium sp. IS-1556 TaxID=1772276 RepID=UPI0009E7FFC2|nr:DEAD/DEAH box helicase [Mycobacterium sp. IS-1556]
MGDFGSLYDALDGDPQRRGRQFEHICKWFLENDPVYRHELRRVWLWSEWHGRWGGDAGIDLVAEDRNGTLWAIQAKAYDPKYRVSRKDIDRFLAESGRAVFGYRMLIATTDLIDRIGERTINDQEKRVTFFRLNDLRTASVDWPKSPGLLRPPRPHKPARPRRHQQQAVRAVVKGFEDADRGQLVMACGTGKTLTALFITEKLEAKRTLVLVPSLSLLKQTLNVWRANCSQEFASLPVCSDDTVSAAKDAPISHTSDLGVPVTTDPEAIAAFLRQRSSPRVVFATYQSSPQIANAFTLGRVPAFDLVIADEAHRCAGPASSDFATVLNPDEIRAGRRLFMTATPRYFTGRVLRAGQEADYEVVSMDDESHFGPVFHRLTFGEAIERDLLTDYQVVVVGVDDDTYRQWAERGVFVTRDGKTVTDARTLAGQIGLAKAMRKYDLRRVISFHSRVSRAREFAAEMPEVIDWMPARQRPKGKLWSRFASGEMPAGDRYVLLQHLGRLDNGDRGLLSNARCLAEGVDVPTLDGVAFNDPRRSEVDIVQAIGRAIRKSEDKSVGTIVIPVFIDTIADTETALEDSAFKPVWDVIKALRSHDEDLGRQLDELRRKMGRTGGVPRLPPKIHIDIPTTVGADFAHAFEAHLVERTTLTWEFWYGLLERYAAEHGHTRIPALQWYEGLRLGQWVAQQRYRQNKGDLDHDRSRLLEVFPDWTWDAVTDQWEEGCRHLQEYVQQHGDALVPQSFRSADGHKLGQWVTIQRTVYREGEMSKARQVRLEALPGWSWEPRQSRFETGYRRLREHAEVHGTTRLVRTYVDPSDGYRLGMWAHHQRASFARGRLSRERIARLDALPGWVWDVHDASWEDSYRRLAEYAAVHGHSTPTKSSSSDGHRLGAWVNQQRTLYNKGKLRADFAARLEALPGWVWAVNDTKWEEGFRHLVDYRDKHGTALVPARYQHCGYPLGSWVGKQREAYRAGTLSAERVRRLAGIPDWSWDPHGEQWERTFALLEKYVAEHGTSRVPQGYVAEGVQLGAWLGTQRTKYAEGQLYPERQRRLERLPKWTWTYSRDLWEERFSVLEKFAAREGHARVPQKHIEDGIALGRWVSIQRRNAKHNVITPERRKRLEALPGWAWHLSPRS